jgi:hypothetical protein
MGVATAGRQFFMQIGQVMGTAIFGVILATSYGSAFADRAGPEAKTVTPPAVYEQFVDPTLALDARQFSTTRAEVLKLPDGQNILGSLLDAQKVGVATAIQDIFLLSSAMAVVVVALALTLPEIPLRRGFASESEAHPHSAAQSVVLETP